MALVEERSRTEQHRGLADCRNAAEASYQEWVDQVYEAHSARCVLIRPWRRNASLWDNMLRGAATAVTLFPATRLTYPRSTQLCFYYFDTSFNTEARDAFADDWYSVGRDLYTVLRRGPEELSESSTDGRPFQHEFNWSVPAH